MSITVGICTTNLESPEFQACLESFNWLSFQSKFPVEIIVASQSGMWITHKKNWIASVAQGDYLCLVHDYYKAPRHWLDQQLWGLNLHKDPDVMVSAIYTKEGRRSADWLVNPNHIIEAIKLYPELRNILMDAAPHENGPQYVAGLPYDISDLTNLQYISGGYIFCKRSLLLENPFNEKLVPGDSEDVEWSERIVKSGATIRFNKGSFVEINKPHKWAVTQMPYEAVDILRKYNEQRKTHNL